MKLKIIVISGVVTTKKQWMQEDSPSITTIIKTLLHPPVPMRTTTITIVLTWALRASGERVRLTILITLGIMALEPRPWHRQRPPPQVRPIVRIVRAQLDLVVVAVGPVVDHPRGAIHPHIYTHTQELCGDIIMMPHYPAQQHTIMVRIVSWLLSIIDYYGDYYFHCNLC